MTHDPETGEIFPTKTPEPAGEPLSPPAGSLTGARRPHARVQTHPEGPSLCKQSFKDECDINKIMKKYVQTGIIEHLNEHKGRYGNFIGYEDYQTSLNQIHEAQDAFLKLPANIRSKFQNNPALFLAFVQNPENLDEMREMGLANPKTPAPAPEASSTDDATEPGGRRSSSTTDAPSVEKPPSGNKPAP